MPRPARAGRSMKRRWGRRGLPIRVRVFSGRSAAMPSLKSVGVIGAGAWGTALAGVAARAGRNVVLYARNAEIAARMKTGHPNPRLPDMRLDERIEVTNRIAAAASADIILIATPAQNLREAAIA